MYIDETGIDTYLYRKQGRSPRGEKVYDKIRGRRFERTSVVAGLVAHKIIAPMIYKDSMTSAFFTKWFDKQLLPSLSEPHLIVMDNASFHPKAKLDKLA
ncbi:transposase, partial [Streptococcus sp. 19428wC2_LYSM12]|uniref:transposase n=1 Tax=unclassified Streptococcus TaxID=2608887 RepID=UPI0018844A87